MTTTATAPPSPKQVAAREIVLRSALEQVGPQPNTLELSLREARELFAFCAERRIMPQLDRAIRGGHLRVPGEVEQEATDAQRAIVVHRIRCEARLLELAATLDASGVPMRVLKGLATGVLDHDNAAMRQVGDVDVLIPRDRWREVFKLLGALPGWESAFVLRRSAEELEHAFTFLAGGIEVDVHHRLFRRAPGHLVAGRDLFADPASFEVHGAQLLGLSRQNRLLHAAGHIVTSPGVMRRWSSHVDVLLLSSNPLAVESFSGGERALVQLGLAHAWSAAGRPVPELADGPDGWRRRGVLWAYGQSQRRPAREHLLELAVAPPLWSLKNQLSWAFGGGKSPIARVRKLRTEAADSSIS